MRDEGVPSLQRLHEVRQMRNDQGQMFVPKGNGLSEMQHAEESMQVHVDNGKG